MNPEELTLKEANAIIIKSLFGGKKIAIESRENKRRDSRYIDDILAIEGAWVEIVPKEGFWVETVIKENNSYIAIPPMVKAELYYGALKSLKKGKVISALEKFLSPFEIIPFGDKEKIRGQARQKFPTK
jgi:hypothetical protein